MSSTTTRPDTVDLSDLIGRQFAVDTTPVPRVPGELQKERNDARARIMYVQRQQMYARPVKPSTEPILPDHE